MSFLPSKTKGTVFQILNRTIWTHNKACKSGRAPNALSYQCEEVETMEHLLYSCEHYSAEIWELAGKSMTLAISQHSGDYILNMVLTPLEIVFNKPHPSILLHVTESTTRKVLILFLQEIKRDIINRRAQPCRREELHPRIQAHLVSVINKISALLEYQGALQFLDGLSLLKCMSRVIIQE
jgi:hypothetical protein